MKKGRKERQVLTHLDPLERAKISDWSFLTSDDKKQIQFPKCLYLKNLKIMDSTHNNIHVYCNTILSEKFRLSLILNYSSKSSLQGRTVWNCPTSQPETGTLIWIRQTVMCQWIRSQKSRWRNYRCQFLRDSLTFLKL